MVEISVIIPTYNVKRYIRECIESAINQSFKDIEIICIDDKSTDKTPEILKEYALKDPRIKVYQNDENKGIAYTRNYSLSLAKGKYIYFLDSDDYLELNALEKLYYLAEEKSLDIVIFRMRNFRNITKREEKILYSDMHYLERSVGNQVFTFEDVKEFAVEMCVILPGKLFRRDLIQDMEFPNGYVFEDVPFFFEAMLKAKRMYFLSENLYNKRIRRKSIMTSHDENYLDFIDIMDILIDVAKRYDVYEELKPYFIQYFINKNDFKIGYLSLRLKFEYFRKMKESYMSKKNEIEEIYDDLYFKYQAMFDSCLKSDNYITYKLRLNYLYIKNLKKVRKERKQEKLMWDKHKPS